MKKKYILEIIFIDSSRDQISCWLSNGNFKMQILIKKNPILFKNSDYVFQYRWNSKEKWLRCNLIPNELFSKTNRNYKNLMKFMLEKIYENNNRNYI